MDSTLNMLIVGFAAVVFNGGGLLQAYRVAKRNSARDVSMLFMIAVLAGTLATFWLAVRTDASAYIITERAIGSLCALVVTGIIGAQRFTDWQQDRAKERYWDQQRLATVKRVDHTRSYKRNGGCDCKRHDGSPYPDKNGCRCPNRSNSGKN